jgi:glycosyltransferase involved in cell wall biosynthesis
MSPTLLDQRFGKSLRIAVGLQIGVINVPEGDADSEAQEETVQRRVLVLNQFALPGGSPGGTRHVELFSHSQRWCPTFIVGDTNYFSGEPVTTTDPRFRIVPLHSKGKSPSRRATGWIEYAVKAVVLGLREHGVDVVYASSPHLLSPVAGWILAKFLGARLVVEIRDLWPESFVALGAMRAEGKMFMALRILERWIYRRADWIVGVSSQWTSYFAEHAPGKRYTAIPNGTDVTAFRAAKPASSGSWILRCQRTKGLNFVFAGSHGPKDGLNLLLDAVPEFPDDLFVLIGDGTDKKQIADRIMRERIDNVLMLAPVSKEALPSYLKHMDVGLHIVSDWSVFKLGMSPNKLHDYLSAGLPVISNAPGEPHDILHQSGSGVGVEPHAISQGLLAMKRLLPSDRQQMGKSGFEWMARNRSRTVVARVLEDVLDDVTRRAP